ncbi:transposase [Schaalia hyovaginalis]|uniref:Mutator family transposase n=1 Tax=Schaalia hyovaginalis TaxID=29316 RepID=A0A923E7B3_9ACTO|nr:transposase-like protein [Schaalia hyovaginalis]
MLQAGLQDLINAEASARIGAARHEQAPERTTRRNGTRPKTLATPAGEVELVIPKLKEGSFFPPVYCLLKRGSTRPLYALICKAWIDGRDP